MDRMPQSSRSQITVIDTDSDGEEKESTTTTRPLENLGDDAPPEKRRRVETKAAGHNASSKTRPKRRIRQPFGTLLGYGPGGVPAFSSNYKKKPVLNPSAATTSTTSTTFPSSDPSGSSRSITIQWYTQQYDWSVRSNFSGYVQLPAVAALTEEQKLPPVEEGESCCKTTIAAGVTAIGTTTSATGSKKDMPETHQSIYTGYRYQCVEYARRWLVQVKRISFASIRMAYQVMDLPHFYRISFPATTTTALGESTKGANKKKTVQQKGIVNIVKTYNGAKVSFTFDTADSSSFSSSMPSCGTVLLWKPQGYFKGTGHIAIVTHCHWQDDDDKEATDGGRQVETAAAKKRNSHNTTKQKKRRLGKIGVAEQNVTDALWEPGENWSRELQIVCEEDEEEVGVVGEEEPTHTPRLTIFDTHYANTEVLGWINPIL